MGRKRLAFQEGFVVAPTVGKSAEGDDSLFVLNNTIVLAMQLTRVWVGDAFSLDEGYRAAQEVIAWAPNKAKEDAEDYYKAKNIPVTPQQLDMVAKRARELAIEYVPLLVRAVAEFEPRAGYSHSVFAAMQSYIFAPMKRLVAACALGRGFIKEGQSKIRQGGSPDDFLDYATIYYVDRWKKQFTDGDRRRPVAEVLNWIPYISGTIRFQLIFYNKEIQDYDFLPIPRYLSEDYSEEIEKAVPREYVDLASLTRIEIGFLQDPKVLHLLLMQLPSELRPYYLDILHYLVDCEELVSLESKNFVLIGTALLRRGVEEWMR